MNRCEMKAMLASKIVEGVHILNADGSVERKPNREAEEAFRQLCEETS